jgi:hypothetical protein
MLGGPRHRTDMRRSGRCVAALWSFLQNSAPRRGALHPCRLVRDTAKWRPTASAARSGQDERCGRPEPRVALTASKRWQRDGASQSPSSRGSVSDEAIQTGGLPRPYRGRLLAPPPRHSHNKNASAASHVCSTLSASSPSARVRPRFTAAIGFPARAAISTKRKPE